jgi:hypothetical protein
MVPAFSVSSDPRRNSVICSGTVVVRSTHSLSPTATTSGGGSDGSEMLFEFDVQARIVWARPVAR